MLNGFDSKTAHNTFKAQILFIRIDKMKLEFKNGKKSISFQIDGEFVIAIMLVVLVML